MSGAKTCRIPDSFAGAKRKNSKPPGLVAQVTAALWLDGRA
jgi:hypothetical protein